VVVVSGNPSGAIFSDPRRGRWLGGAGRASRKILVIQPFFREPSSERIVALLDAAVASVGTAPKYTVSDKGSRFFSAVTQKPAQAFAEWFRRWAFDLASGLSVKQAATRPLRTMV
jgi:hypothetical protein